MARIRTVKPEFWTDEKVVECSPTARLLFIGLWNFCDDYGSHQYSPKQIKMEIFPGDDFKMIEIEEWLSELISARLIRTYVIDDKRYLRVCGWRHQKIEKPSRKHPDPIQFDDHSSTIRRPFDDDQPAEGKGREGKGKEKEKEYKKEKNPAHEKIKHLDSVYLTSREHETLITKYGREPTEKAIEILNNAIMSKGYKYKSHYHTIIGWPMKEVAGNGNKAPVMPKTYAQAKDAEKRAIFATYNAQKEVSHGNAENNPDGNNKIAGRLPLPGPVS